MRYSFQLWGSLLCPSQDDLASYLINGVGMGLRAHAGAWLNRKRQVWLISYLYCLFSRYAMAGSNPLPLSPPVNAGGGSEDSRGVSITHGEILCPVVDQRSSLIMFINPI